MYKMTYSLILILIIVIFNGCTSSKRVKLPENVSNINFIDLMEVLELNKDNDILFSSNSLYSPKYRKTNYQDYFKIMNEFCSLKDAKLLNSNKEALKNIVDNYAVIDNLRYCYNENNTLFVIFRTVNKQDWMKYPRYRFYVTNSKKITNSIENYITKIKEEQEKERLIQEKTQKQMHQKLLTLSKRFNEIKQNALYNSYISTYEKNAFQKIEGISYFDFSSLLHDRYGKDKIAFYLNNFTIMEINRSTKDKFTKKEINKFKINYSLNIVNAKLKKANKKINDPKNIILDKNDNNSIKLIIGVKKLENPKINRSCNDKTKQNLLYGLETEISKYINLFCSKYYTYDAVFYNLIVYDSKTNKIIFYSE